MSSRVPDSDPRSPDVYYILVLFEARYHAFVIEQFENDQTPFFFSFFFHHFENVHFSGGSSRGLSAKDWPVISTSDLQHPFVYAATTSQM